MSETPFPWPDGKRCAVSLTFDDARTSQLDSGIPLLDRHGIKATFYASLGPLNDRAAEWQRAAASGHEIGNHTASHPCSGNFPWARKNALEDFDLERMEAELRTANTSITSVTGKLPKSFAYPCGQTFVGKERTRRSYIPMISKMFAAGRGFLWETHAHPAYCDLAHLPGISFDTLSFDAIMPMLKKAFDDGGWLILVGHDVGQDHFQSVHTETLNAVCSALESSKTDFWTTTVAEIAEWIRKNRQGV